MILKVVPFAPFMVFSFSKFRAWLRVDASPRPLGKKTLLNQCNYSCTPIHKWSFSSCCWVYENYNYSYSPMAGTCSSSISPVPAITASAFYSMPKSRLTTPQPRPSWDATTLFITVVISLSIYGINYPYSINVMNTLNKASHLSCKNLIVFLHNNNYLLLNLNIKNSW